jgi:phospholipid transport system transporter-binding protein
MGAALPEQLTLANASQILQNLDRSVLGAAGPVVQIDASALKNFDSSAIAVLLELRRRLLAQGKTLQVVAWPERLQGLVALYGVGELLQA